jgi:hypothetical protein
MVLLGDEAQVDAHFGLFGDRLILTQHRCMVCTERNIGLEIVLDAPDRSPTTLVMWNLISIHLETVVVLVQDRCTICAERTIGSEIVLDASDGTSRRRGSIRCSFWSVWR